MFIRFCSCGKIIINIIFAICWNIGPDINIKNSFLYDAFNGKKNFDIPPKGYKYIFLTSTFNNIATKKCPSSCIMINVIIMINGINDAVSIDNTANI